MDDEINGEEPQAARQTRTTRTRPALCGALLSLLEEKSFDQVTVREITARADVGYATFFRRYPDKEALLHDLAAREISKLLAMAKPILFAVDSRAAAQAFCAYLWEHRKLWAALLAGAAPILKDEFIRKIQNQTAQRPRQHAWPSADLTLSFAVAGTIEIMAWWLKQAEPPSVSQMAEALDLLVITPSIARARDTFSGTRSPAARPRTA